MNCEKFQMMISAKLDGELNAAEALELEKHLGYCTECRKDFEEMEKLQSRVDKFSAKAMELDSEYVWKKMKPSFTPAHNKWNFINWTLRIAAALIAVFLVFYFRNGVSNQQSDIKMAALGNPLSPEEILSARLVESTLIRGGAISE